MPLPTSKVTGLTPKQAVFVAEMERHGLQTRAAEVAGYKHPAVAGSKLSNPDTFPVVAAAVARALERRKLAGIKSADDVLRYIHTTMFFSPLQFFEPGENGGWLIDESKWADLPPEIGCLIESVELVVVSVETLAGIVETKKVKVRLVSKTQAMALAARHQLGDKHAVTIGEAKGIDWDDLAARGSLVTKGSELEERIRATEVNENRMKEIAGGQLERAPIVVEVKVGKQPEDME